MTDQDRIKIAWFRSLGKLGECRLSLYRNNLLGKLIAKEIITLQDVEEIETARTDFGQLKVLFDNYLLQRGFEGFNEFSAILRRLKYKDFADSLEQNFTTVEFSNDKRCLLFGTFPTLTNSLTVTRPDEEMALQMSTFKMCQSKLPGAVFVTGEPGLGRTTLLVRAIVEDKAFLESCQISLIIWINMTHFLSSSRTMKLQNETEIENPFAIYNLVASYLHLVPSNNGESSFNAANLLQKYFKEIGPEKRFIFIFDDVTHEQKIDLVLESIFQIAPSANIRAIVAARNRAELTPSACLSTPEFIKIRHLSNELVGQILSSKSSANQVILPELIQMCSGSPLFASMLAGIIRSAFDVEKCNEAIKRIYLRLLESFSSISTSPNDIDNTFLIMALLRDEDFVPWRRRLEAFLLFEKETPVPLGDLAVLWQCANLKEAETICEQLSYSLGSLLTEYIDKTYSLHPVIYSSLLLDMMTKGRNVDSFRTYMLSKNNCLQVTIQNQCSFLFRRAVAILMRNSDNSCLFKICSKEVLCLLGRTVWMLAPDFNKPKRDFSIQFLCEIVELMLEKDFQRAIEHLQPDVLQLLLDSATGVQNNRPWYSNAFLITIMCGFGYLREVFLRKLVFLETLSRQKDDNGMNALLLATSRNDLTTIQRLLNLTEFRNEILVRNNSEGYTALLLASRNGLAQICAEILAKCRETASSLLEDVDRCGNSAVTLAARYGNVHTLKLLLSYQIRDMQEANLNQCGDSALWLAFVHNHLETAELLLRDKNVRHLDQGERHVLLQRAKMHSKRRVEEMITKWYPNNGRPLQPDCTLIKKPLFRLLLWSEDGDEKEVIGNHVLSAIMSDQANAVIANVVPIEKSIAGCLIVASYFGHASVIEALLRNFRNKCDVNSSQYFKNASSPLYVASACGHKGAVEALIELGGDVDKANINGRTPLMVASANGHLQIVHILLENGADMRSRDENGITPLYIASHNGHVEIVKILLLHAASKGEDIILSSRKWSGCTPLMAASKNGHDPVVRLLIKHGAVVDAKTPQGFTALNVALWKQQKTTVRAFHRNASKGVSFLVRRRNQYYCWFMKMACCTKKKAPYKRTKCCFHMRNCFSLS